MFISSTVLLLWTLWLRANICWQWEVGLPRSEWQYLVSCLGARMSTRSVPKPTRNQLASLRGIWKGLLRNWNAWLTLDLSDRDSSMEYACTLWDPSQRIGGEAAKTVNLLRESRAWWLKWGSSTTPLVSLLCYTSSTWTPGGTSKNIIVASQSCTKSFMSMWRCLQTIWIWLQTDRGSSNCDKTETAKILPCSTTVSFVPRTITQWTLPDSIALQQHRYLHSELRSQLSCHTPVGACTPRCCDILIETMATPDPDPEPSFRDRIARSSAISRKP